VILACAGTLLVAAPAESALALTVAAQNVAAVEGSPFAGTVATFSDLRPVSCQSGYSALVTWADHTTSPGTVGTGVPDATGLNCNYVVSAGRTFPDEGAGMFTVSVTGLLGTGTASATATVADAPLAAAAVPITATEGAAFGATIATFTDVNPNAALGDFSATVAWGDGSSGPASVTVDPGGGFAVFAGHTYVDPGAYTATVAVADLGGSTAGATVPAAVADAPLSAAATPIAAVEDTAFNAAVATFTDPDPGRPAGYYTASIAWGDGTTSAATVAAGPSGGFVVTGGHAYVNPGVYTATATIVDPGGQRTTAAPQVTVADAPLGSAGRQLVATEGAVLRATVAGFTDPDPGRPPTYYSASVAWGDGTTTAGTIAADPTGGFTVGAEHAYADPGSYPVTVTIADPGGQRTAASTGIVVVDAPLHSTGGQIAATEGAPFTATVAAFADDDPGRPAGHYSASVDWGDGSGSAAGNVGADGSGGFTVTADHAYARPGTYAVTATIADPDGQQTTATSSVPVADAPLVAAGNQISTEVGTSFQAAVANFRDADPNAASGLYTATVAWGDGATTTDPAIAAGPDGTFTVSAGHAYPLAGTYATTTTVTDTVGGATATAAGSVTVDAPPSPPTPPAGTPTPTPTPPKPVPKVTPPAPPPVVGVSQPRVAGTTTLSLRLTCPASADRCRGVARVITLPARGRKAPLRGGTSLGSALFVIGSGDAKTVTIPVVKRLRRVLRQARSVRLAGVAIAFGANGHNAAATGPTVVISTLGLR
jgi:hypothetical protein